MFSKRRFNISFVSVLSFTFSLILCFSIFLFTTDSSVFSHSLEEVYFLMWLILSYGRHSYVLVY